jgi:Gpi18-like mannosyltransferase
VVTTKQNLQTTPVQEDSPKRTAVWDILGLFFVTRIALMLVTYIGYILLTAPKYSSTPVDTTKFFATWEHWDVARYINIAQHGYQTKYDLAFFPLFPLLTKIIASLFGGHGYLLIGMLISNGALLASLFLLYQLATGALGEKVGRRAILYLCIFPTALFFFAAYNESLFLMFTLGVFLTVRRQRWWLAGVLGFFAALTRSSGILLVIPVLYELWLVRKSLFSSVRNVTLGLFPLVLIPLGTLLYCIYCWRISGDPLAFATVQSHWDRHFSFPWQGIFQALYEIFWVQPFGSFFEVHNLIDLSATLVFIFLIIAGWRVLRTSFTIWAATLLLFVSLSPAVAQHDALASNQRFVLELFPCFITLAVLGMKHPRVHQAILVLSPLLLAMFSLIFVMNLWMV